MQNFAKNSWTSACAAAKNMLYMPIVLRTSGVVSCLAAALLCSNALAQLNTPLGGEYVLSGPLSGDQTYPHVSVRPSGGYVVWQDNFVDGNGLGIGARRLDSSLSPTVLASFRVNQQTAGNQERPQVAMLPTGVAGFVWQGGLAAYQHIWFRALNSNGTFASTTDVRLNTYTNGAQGTPAIAALTTTNFAVAWTSLHQDGSYRGVYMRVVGPTGQLITAPVQVNQFSPNNQRDPAIAALSGGGFVVVWASEDQTLNGAEVHIYARVYTAAGAAVGDEFRVNTSNHICANPTVGGLAGGGFTVAWSQRHTTQSNSWDVFARSFEASGASLQNAFRVNAYTYGDQFAPRIAFHNNVQLIVWSSMGQDGSFEGVFGRSLALGVPNGDEVTNNTTTVSRQIHPIVTSDGGGRLLVVWSSYRGGSGFDLVGQKYSAGQALAPPPPPFVSALSASRLSVAWPPVVGFPVTHYNIYIDGGQPPEAPAAVVTSNSWTKTGLAPESTHVFRISYTMASGETSPLSQPATGTTWGDDENLDGLPDDWQEAHWGYKPEDWPSRDSDSDGDGASNASEYLAGTDPTDPSSVFRTRLVNSEQGRWLEWSSRPGCIYQVQTSGSVGGTWSNLGAARFAADVTDSVLVTPGSAAGFYRIIRVR